MERCLKCQGSLRHDWEFPGLVCQMCGVVYYFNRFNREDYSEMSKRRASHWGWARSPNLPPDLSTRAHQGLRTTSEVVSELQ